MIHKSIAIILDNWVEKINEDEFYFSNTFEQLFQEKTSYEAFEFIPHMLEAILETNDDFVSAQLIFHLNRLYGKADTTEIHTELSEQQTKLEKHIASLNGQYAMRDYHEFKQDSRLK